MKKIFTFILVAGMALLAVSCQNNSAVKENKNEQSEINATSKPENTSTTMDDILTRRSIRHYTDEMPPMEVIE